MYRADMEGENVDSRLLKLAEHSKMTYQVENVVREIRKMEGVVEMQIEWQALPDS